jgi:site-specific recombinase XerD
MATKKPKAKVRGVYEKEPGSEIWWIQYFANGQRKREKVGRRSDAISLYQQRQTEVRAGVKMPENIRVKGERLEAVLLRAIDWYESHKKATTCRSAKIHLNLAKAELGHHVASELTPQDVDRWITSHKEWSPGTKNRYKASLSRALQLAVVSGQLSRNVARLVTTRKEDNTRVRWVSDEEEKRIVTTIKKRCPLQLPAYLVAVHTGMRKGEQFKLKWSQVDLERKKIFLTLTKSGKNREIPMSETCHKILTELAKTKKNEYVFQATKREGNLTDPRKWFVNVLTEAKVTNLHWHDLRHTFCSRLVMRGVDILTVSKLAGHGDVSVTQRYAHLSPEHLAGAVNVLDKA